MKINLFIFLYLFIHLFLPSCICPRNSKSRKAQQLSNKRRVPHCSDTQQKYGKILINIFLGKGSNTKSILCCKN